MCCAAAKLTKNQKGKVYKAMLMPLLVYGAEAWIVTKREEGLLERRNMRMLRWILGVSLEDKKRKEVILTEFLNN